MNSFDIGNTSNNTIKVYKITNENSAEINKKNILIIGNIYAKDIVEANISYLWTQDLLQNNNLSYLDNLNIYIIPSLNPDGMDTSLQTQNSLLLTNNEGININRNFSFNWIHGNSDEDNTQNQYNKGEYPYSSNEALALQNFLNNYKIEFCLFNMTDELAQNQVKFPYKWAEIRESPDFNAFNKLAQNTANIVNNNWIHNPNTERNGNLLDELYVNYGIIPFQLSFGFHYVLPDENEVIQQKNYLTSIINHFFDTIVNYESVDNTKPGFLELNIVDNNTLQNIEANVSIDGLHTTAFQNNKSNAENGMYYRFISEGTYYLIIEKKGYETHYQQISINENQHLYQQIQLQAKEPANIHFEVSQDNQALSSILYINLDGFEDIITIDGSASYETFEGQHEFTLFTQSLAPIKKSIYIRPGTNNIHFEPAYTNHIFYEDFEGTCCLWIMNGPWLVVSDSTHNSYFIKDSYSDTGFYDVNADYTLEISAPLSLIGYTGQDVFLSFEHSVYTEWDNDYVTIEVSYDAINWNPIFKYAGNTKGWRHELISLNNFVENDLFLRFRLKDGIEDYANHPMLTDPGWKIDNIEITGSVSTVNTQELLIEKPNLPIINTYPNPFNPLLNISFDIKNKTEILDIKIFNIKGQLVEQTKLTDKQIKSGHYVWNAKSLSSGIYFVTLIVDNTHKITKKVILLK
jgi:hypothetical protein